MAAPAQWGGQELPQAVNAACIEMWNSASMAFGIGPVLTMAAVDALEAYGSDDLKQRYLGKLVTGEWMGTMELTEPQAGSDVGALRTKAARAGDGSYRIKGSKIFITYGEHDLTDNIIHFVLARLPDAPAGTKGISLFLVPKIMPDGTRNDVRAHSVEHKLGIHASPTCTMVYGDKGGAIGFLIGEENKGMAAMFKMMNRARLAVGLQGVAIAERATQQALSYARERKQGPASAIIAYPDVKRMLLTMRALTGAARAICYSPGVAQSTAPNARRTMRCAKARTSAPRCSPRSRKPSPPTSASRSLRWACRCTAAWASSRRPAPRSITATPASPRSTKAPTASRRIDLVTRKIPLEGGATVALYLNELRRTVPRSRPATIRPSARLRRGSPRRSTASSGRRNGCWRRSPPMRRLPAPRPICACSALLPAAACWPSRRSPPRARTATAPRASR